MVILDSNFYYYRKEKMKKAILLVIAVLGFVSAQAQSVELIPYYGFQLGGSFYYYTQNGKYVEKAKVKDNPNYGVGLNVNVDDETTIELMWNRMDSHTDLYYNFENHRVDVVSEYYTLGGLKNFPNGNVVPFVGGSLGVGVFTFKEGSKTEKATRFAGTLQGGAKIYFSDRVGIRLQARMLIPMYFSGVGLGCGISTGGSSCGGGATFGSEILQGDFTGGLIIKLKD